MKFYSLLPIALTLLFLSNCSHHPHKVSEDSGQWSQTPFTSYQRIYFSAQPDEQALKAAKEDGIGVVINLRTVEEQKKLAFDEKEVSTKLGMTYYNIPFDGSQPIQAKTIERIESKVKKHHRSEKILVHCSSGNRAASWFAIHLAEHHQLKPEEAISKAREKGLTKASLEKKVSQWITKKSAVTK